MIIKAKKEDFNEYLKLKRIEEKEYGKIVGENIKYPKDSILRKEFNGTFDSKKDLIFVVKKDNKLVGYVHGSFIKTSYHKYGYIEDLFVLKDFRKKGLASKLIKQFIQAVKKKGYKKIHLHVNTINVPAKKLYNKLGFKLVHYDFVKEWK